MHSQWSATWSRPPPYNQSWLVLHQKSGGTQIEYEVRGPRILHADFKILVESRISDFKAPVEYIKAITEAASRLKQMGCDIPDHITVLHLQNGLTPEWNSVGQIPGQKREKRVSARNEEPDSSRNTDPSRASKATATTQFVSIGAPGKARFPGTTVRKLDTRRGIAGSNILNSGREKQRTRRLGTETILPRRPEQRGRHLTRTNDYMAVILLKSRPSKNSIRLLWLLPP